MRPTCGRSGSGANGESAGSSNLRRDRVRWLPPTPWRRATIERNAEIIRQWKVLIDIATSADCTIQSLSKKHGVCDRTIRRDLAALEAAGFALYPESVDGLHCWRLASRPMKAITETVFSLPELCAFYVNRTQLAAAGGLPLDQNLHSALAKVSRALGPRMKAYLDRLSVVLTLKPEPRHRPDPKGSPVAVEDLVKATIDHRRVDMDYHSFASGRVKSYAIEPYRLTFGNGGLYLFAYVPAYGQMRTFAVQRIRSLTVSDQTFSPVQEVSAGPYDDSIGIFSGGKPEPLEIEFSPKVAPYVEEREWHRTQAIARKPDGSIVLKMTIAIDVPLKSWILGFGHQARVLKPSSLAETIFEELEEAREQYAPRMEFELPPAIYEDRRQGRLPFQGPRARRSVYRRRSRTAPGA